MGSKLNISYSVKFSISAPLSLVISQGRDSLLEWIEDPSYPNTTLSWNIIHGDGMIQQDILSSKSYYITLGSLNTDEVDVIMLICQFVLVIVFLGASSFEIISTAKL